MNTTAATTTITTIDLEFQFFRSATRLRKVDQGHKAMMLRNHEAKVGRVTATTEQLQDALRAALAQWKMYAELEERDLATEQSEEAIRFRELRELVKP
jgi:tryptophan synthase beta subunit